ncbi:MAG: leucine-rich repeat domain-containing protein [Bacteroidota bacterium]
MKIIHALFSLVITLLATGCLDHSPALPSLENQPEAAVSQFQTSLEELNEELPKESPKWDQFFTERGAIALWQQLQRINNEAQLVFSLKNLQFDQADVTDEVGAGIARHLAYYHKYQVNVLRIIGGSSPGKKLTSFDPAIGALKSLQELWLADNQLQALPESIGKLTRLQELWLAKNQLQALPESIGELKGLQELWLADNQLQALPESIGELTSLQDLWLDGNQLTCLSEKLLPWFQQINYKNTDQNPWLSPDDLPLVDFGYLMANQDNRHSWKEYENIVYFEHEIPFYVDRQLVTEQDVNDMLNDLVGKQCYRVH